MMGDVARYIGNFISTLYMVVIASVVVAWPLALWKLWDIGWWLWNNVSVTVK